MMSNGKCFLLKPCRVIPGNKLRAFYKQDLGVKRQIQAYWRNSNLSKITWRFAHHLLVCCVLDMAFVISSSFCYGNLTKSIVRQHKHESISLVARSSANVRFCDDISTFSSPACLQKSQRLERQAIIIKLQFFRFAEFH